MFTKITRNQLRAGVTALLAAGCCGLLAASLAAPAAAAFTSASGSAATPRAWGIAERIPKLDAIAAALGSAGDAGNPGGGVDLNSVSCTRPGYCTAGGDLYSGSGNQGAVEEGWVASEVGGVWTAPKVINIGNADFFVHYIIVESVSCASPGNCAAVGYDTEEVEFTGFVDTSGAFVINQVNGRWSAPRQIPGTDALNKQSYATASSVSCSAPGYCGVTGIVDNGTEFVATETNGIWGTAQTVRGFTSAPGAAFRGLVNVGPVISCPRPGECTVAGSETGPSGDTVTSVVTQAGGTWGATKRLPGLASAGRVTALSCPASGHCSAGGWATSGTHTVPFVASESGGRWTSSAVRGFAALSPPSADTGSVTALSCASPGNCSAGGTYQPAYLEVGAFVVSEAGGKWQTARPVAGVAKTERGLSLPSMSCPAAGYCAAVVSRAGAGFVAVQSGGSWGTARPVAGTTGTGGMLGTGGTGGVTSVSCAAPGRCVAGGNDHAGTEVWVLERSAAASTLTTVTVSKPKVSYGAEQAQRITVTVRATTPTPAGRVDVKVNGHVVCTITLRHGTGSCRLTPWQLKPGTYKVAAAYRGAAPYKSSVSAMKTFKVTG